MFNAQKYRCDDTACGGLTDFAKGKHALMFNRRLHPCQARMSSISHRIAAKSNMEICIDCGSI
jgi:hypothetical protein